MTALYQRLKDIDIKSPSALKISTRRYRIEKASYSSTSIMMWLANAWCSCLAASAAAVVVGRIFDFAFLRRLRLASSLGWAEDPCKLVLFIVTLKIKTQSSFDFSIKEKEPILLLTSDSCDVFLL